MPNFSDRQFATSILNEFVEHRNASLLTDCLIHPSLSVKTFRDMTKFNLEQQLHEFLSVEDDYLAMMSNFNRYDSDYYYYFLNLGTLFLALEDYQQAAKCFKISMEYPLKAEMSATDRLFQLPCLLAGASLELAGDFNGAIANYSEGLHDHFKTNSAMHDYSQSIKRCESKLGQPTQTMQIMYQPQETAEFELRHANDFSKKTLYEQLGLRSAERTSSPQAFLHACFEGFDPMDNWRFYVDGSQQINSTELGWLGWERREPNSISAMDEVFSYLAQQIDKPITEETVRTIHSLSTRNVTGLNGTNAIGNEFVIPGEYRTTEVNLSISIGFNATRKGISDLLERAEKEEYYHCRPLGFTNYGTLNYVWQIKKTPHEFLQKRLIDALNEYYKGIEELDPKEENYRAIIRIIVNCIKKIELSHLFRDGNGRTIYALLNLMLLQNKLPPAMLYDPNYFDGYSEEELVDEVIKGMKHFFFVKEHGTYPGSKSTEQLIKENVDEGKQNKTVMNQVEADFFRAASRGNIPLLEQYIASGIDLAITDEYGNNALTIAAYYGQLECVKNILTLKPQLLDSQWQDGATALYLAAYNGQEEVVDYLLKNKANPNITSVYELKPSAIAMKMDHLEAARKIQAIENSVSESMMTGETERKPHIFFRGNTPSQQVKDAEKNIMSCLMADKLPLKFLIEAFSELSTLKDNIFHYKQVDRKLIDKLLQQIGKSDDFLAAEIPIDVLQKFTTLLKAKREDINFYNENERESLELILNQMLLMIVVKQSRTLPSMKDLVQLIENIMLKDDVNHIDNREEKTIDLLFANPIILSKFLDLTNYSSVWKQKLNSMLSEYPRYSLTILDKMLKTGVIRQLVNNAYDLTTVLDICSKNNQQSGLITYLLTEKNLFNSCMKSSYDFESFVKAAPEFKEQLLIYLLTNEAFFRKIMEDNFIVILKLFNETASQQQLISRLFSDEETSAFNTCFSSIYAFENFAKIAPQFKEMLFSRLLMNNTLFNTVISYSSDLATLLRTFDEPAEQQKLISQVFANEKIAANCFHYSFSIEAIVQAAPHYGNEILAHILITPSIYTNIGVTELKKIFSNDEQCALIEIKEKQISPPQLFNESLHNDDKTVAKDNPNQFFAASEKKHSEQRDPLVDEEQQASKKPKK